MGGGGEDTHPGIGMISSPWAINHASANCPGLTPLLSATSPIASTSFRFAPKFSGENLGKNLLQSPSSKSLGLLIAPVSTPLPSGLYATMETPSSRAVARRSISGRSMSREKGEYSTWTAEIGWMAWARRRSDAVHSEMPMCLIFPSLHGVLDGL